MLTAETSSKVTRYIEPAGRVHPGTMTVHPHSFRAPGLPIIDVQGFTGIRLPSHVIAH